MCVIRGHEYAVARHGDTAVDAARRHPEQATRARPLVVPEHGTRTGVEREALVGGGDIHHTVDDDRRDLQPGAAGQGKRPFLRHASQRLRA